MLLSAEILALAAIALATACIAPPKSAAEARERAYSQIERVLDERAETDRQADRRLVVAGDLSRNTERWIQEVQSFWSELRRRNAVYATPREELEGMIDRHLARRSELRARAFGAIDRLEQEVDRKTWRELSRPLAVVLEAALEDASTDLLAGGTETELAARVLDPRRRDAALGVLERMHAAAQDYSAQLGPELEELRADLLDSGPRASGGEAAVLAEVDGQRRALLVKLLNLRDELRREVRPDEWLAVFGEGGG